MGSKPTHTSGITKAQKKLMKRPAVEVEMLAIITLIVFLFPVV